MVGYGGLVGYIVVLRYVLLISRLIVASRIWGSNSRIWCSTLGCSFTYSSCVISIIRLKFNIKG
jgi:hypothetical protein